MKIKNLLKVLFCTGVVLIGIGKVSAIDVNSLKLEYKSNQSMGSINVIGELDDKSYYVKFIKDGEESTPEIPLGSTSISVNKNGTQDVSRWFAVDINTKEVEGSEFMYIEAKIHKAYIAECTTTECIMSNYPIQYDRPELPKYGKRYSVWDSATKEISISPSFPTDIVLNLGVKIGRIEDKELLVSLSKNENDSTEKLLNYAKKDANGTLFELRDDSEKLIENFSRVEGAYYYVYVINEDYGGSFISVEDVIVMQGGNDLVSGKIILWDNFSWDLELKADTEVKVNVDSKEENPNTGDKTLLLACSTILIAGASIVIKKQLNRI